MFHPSVGMVILLSLYNTFISSGQPLPSDRQATKDEALMEQRIMADIRSLVMQTCSCGASTDYKTDILSSQIQDLTSRIAAMEKLFLSQRRRECAALFGTPFWIGIRWTENSWKWVNNGKVVEEKDTRWAVGQPNGRSNDRCVVVSTKEKKWYDRICKKTFYFACEM